MHARRKIAVAGATGRAGHHVVELLQAAGHDVVPISRSSGVDVVTGEGLQQALEGVEALIDVSTGASPDQAEATAFFTAAARNLQEAGERAGLQRIVVASIIGADRVTAGYNAAKVAHEQAIVSGPVPVRILRASQFHELVGQMIVWGRQGDVSYVPQMRTQPVAARTAAQALIDLALDPEPVPAPGSPGAIVELAGPREERLAELAGQLVARSDDPVRIQEVYDPADPVQVGFASGALLPGPAATLAGPTFEAWLADAA